jgi:hypothetical protein
LILDIEFNFIIVKAIIGYEVRPAQPNEFPALVGIANHVPHSPLNQRLVCTGTLITADHVLSSQHCFYNIEYNHLEIIIGSHDLRLGNIYFPIWGISFDNWAEVNNIVRPCDDNDIAILKVI